MSGNTLVLASLTGTATGPVAALPGPAAAPLLLQLTGDAVRQLLGMLGVFLVVLVGVPLLVGGLTYAALRHRYPHVPARRKTVLLYAGGAYWLVGLAATTLTLAPRSGQSRTAFLWLGAVVGLGLTVGGAALGYFKKQPAA